jgi:hypothetical protein
MARFVGGKEEIDAQLTADIQIMNALSPEQLSQFLDIVVAFLLNPGVRRHTTLS